MSNSSNKVLILQTALPFAISAILINISGNNNPYLNYCIMVLLYLVMVVVLINKGTLKNLLYCVAPIAFIAMVLPLFTGVIVDQKISPSDIIRENVDKVRLLTTLGINAKVPNGIVSNIATTTMEINDVSDCKMVFDRCYVSEENYNELYVLYSKLNKHLVDLETYTSSFKDQARKAIDNKLIHNYVKLNHWRASEAESSYYSEYKENRFDKQYYGAVAVFLLILLQLILLAFKIKSEYIQNSEMKNKLDGLKEDIV